MQDANRFIVVTGGPGSGKSTLISALCAEGFTGMPEAGRAIIQAQAAIGGAALPWADRFAFSELMLSWEQRSITKRRATRALCPLRKLRRPTTPWRRPMLGWGMSWWRCLSRPCPSG